MNEKDSGRVELSTSALNKRIAKIAAPIAVQGMVSATLTMVDNLMVGLLGETELAAVGVGGQLFMIHYLVLFGLVSGSATFAAQFYGTRDMANIRKVIGFAFMLLGVLGLLMFFASNLLTIPILSIYTNDPAVRDLAAQYVRICSPAFLMLAVSSPLEMAFKATQQVKIPMVISAVVFSSNTFINYIFIFGKFGMPRLGVAGAAVGTICARTIELLLNLYFAFRSSNEFRGSVRSYFGWDRELIVRIVKNATPTTINEFLWSLGQTMYVAAYNRIGTTAYAAYQAANSIFNIFSFASFSIGDAALILLGEKLGEGDKLSTWVMSKHFIKLAIEVGLVVGMFTIVIAKPLSGIFDLTDEGKRDVFLVIIVFGATMFLDLFSGLMITGILRAGGDTRFAMIAESSCVWLVGVPMAFLAALVFHLPIHIAVLLTRTEQLVKNTILLNRYRSKKWMNTVIEDL